MLAGTVVCYFAMGHLPDMYIHVSVYGFILAGIGYIIELLKKKEKNAADHIEWILEKKFKVFFEELKTIRTMILKLEDRRERSDFTPPPIPHIKTDEKQVFTASQPPPIVFPKMKQAE